MDPASLPRASPMPPLLQHVHHLLNHMWTGRVDVLETPPLSEEEMEWKHSRVPPEGAEEPGL